MKANNFYVLFLESLRGVDDLRTLENFLYDDFDDDMYGYYEMAMFLARVACYNHGNFARVKVYPHDMEVVEGVSGFKSYE